MGRSQTRPFKQTDVAGRQAAVLRRVAVRDAAAAGSFGTGSGAGAEGGRKGRERLARGSGGRATRVSPWRPRRESEGRARLRPPASDWPLPPARCPLAVPGAAAPRHWLARFWIPNLKFLKSAQRERDALTACGGAGAALQVSAGWAASSAGSRSGAAGLRGWDSSAVGPARMHAAPRSGLRG